MRTVSLLLLLIPFVHCFFKRAVEETTTTTTTTTTQNDVEKSTFIGDKYDYNKMGITVDHGLSLYKQLQNQQSDCFKKVTLQLVNGCRTLKSVKSIENMEFALRLTLCELSFTNLHIPSECQLLQKLQQEEEAGINNKRDLQKQELIKQCVNQLSRSTQTWTSYTGYFREVVLICFALRYPMEKEILEQLHLNITVNQAKNFELLAQQQQYLAAWRTEEVRSLDILNQSQSQLISQLEYIQRVQLQRTSDQLNSILNSTVALRNETESSIVQYEDSLHVAVQDIQSQLSEFLEQQQDSIQMFVRNSILSQLEEINKQLLDYQQDWIGYLNTTKHAYMEALELWRATIDSLNSSLSDIIDQDLERIQQNLLAIQSQVSTILMPFHWMNEVSRDFTMYAQLCFLDLITYALIVYQACLYKNSNYIQGAVFSILVMIAYSYVCSHWPFRFLPIAPSDKRYGKALIIIVQCFMVYCSTRLRPIISVAALRKTLSPVLKKWLKVANDGTADSGGSLKFIEDDELYAHSQYYQQQSNTGSQGCNVELEPAMKAAAAAVPTLAFPVQQQPIIVTRVLQPYVDAEVTEKLLLSDDEEDSHAFTESFSLSKPRHCHFHRYYSYDDSSSSVT